MFPPEQAELTENARRVLESRYLKKDPGGQVVEEPEDMFARVARNVASAEEHYDAGPDAGAVEEQFRDALLSLDFLPNSPCLMNAGRDLQQLAACFVLEVRDSLDSIFDTLKHTALIHQSGGGTGFSFSALRPRGAYISTSGGQASGPVSFIRIFNAATDAINQGGFRRGANMAVLRVDHPDILEFARSKNEEGSLVNFNISVGATARFMDAVGEGAGFALVHPASGEVADKVAADEVFDAIVESAWKNGEPGMVFLDTVNSINDEGRTSNPTPALGRIEATNPCGEAPLLPFESCVLGSVNLAHVLTGRPPDCSVDWDELGRLVRLGVRFLDNVLTVTRHPLPQVADITTANRKIGLGVMGFADMLVRMGIPYDDERAVQTAREVMEFIAGEADAASEQLAAERGPFPNYPDSVYARRERPIRNAVRTTIAPTGTISIIAGCSGGIEPIFAVAFERHVLGGQTLKEVHPDLRALCEREGYGLPDEVMERIVETGMVRPIEELPDVVRRLLVTAREVPPMQHLRVQAAFQRHTDNAVSKTVNLPADAEQDDVRDIYLRAYELGCKGVTVYRDTSRKSQVLAVECCNIGDACTD
ncbi:MAG: adenosylcobalamin-dependent ribonucleoside-diphosphate reductase [Candidatus Brocadiia bacterium]